MPLEERAKPIDATCLLCGETVSRRGLTTHLKSCRDKHLSDAAVPPERIFHLMVDGGWTKDYYLHLEAPASLKFRELDQFLREIWLECCGHLSEFRVGSGRAPMGLAGGANGKAAMSGPLSRRLSQGMAFEHDYDFGTTTTVSLKVIDESERVRRGDGVFLIARNNDPQLPCQECGERLATQICSECIWDGWGLLCNECAPAHECGEEMLLPVVNSPRLGMCGYVGPATWSNTPVGKGRKQKQS